MQTRSVGLNVSGLGPNTQTEAGLYDPEDPVLNQNITQFDDYIYNSFLYPANKKEALAYLDEGGPLPNRYAKVIVVRGSVPDVMEYKVSLLTKSHDNATRK